MENDAPIAGNQPNESLKENGGAEHPPAALAAPALIQSFDKMPEGVELPHVPGSAEEKAAERDALARIAASLSGADAASSPPQAPKEAGTLSSITRNYNDIPAESGVTPAPAAFSAKDLPVGKPTTPKAPPILRAMDMLNRGNAVLAAQEAAKQRAPETPAPTNSAAPAPAPSEHGAVAAETRGQAAGAVRSEEALAETPFERNLRESGLKEALPHSERAAPEKVAPLEKETPEGLPRIRTYADDMGQEIRKRGATISSIVTAEKARAPRTVPEEPARRRSNMYLLGAAVLIVLGFGIVGGTAYYLIPKAAPVATSAPSFIPVNHRETVDYQSGQSLADALAKAKASATLSLGEITEFDITENGAPLSAAETLAALGAPNELARNATGIMIGIHAYNHVQPFILVSVSAYDLAFQAMLKWEQNIGDSLGMFFAPAGAPIDTIGTHAPALSFGDAVIANLDVRQSQSAWPILYAFPRQNLLVITTNEGTLREVMTRVSLQGNSQ